VLAGQHEHAGILAELVVQADQASVAQELGGDPTKARQAPKQALQRKLLDGLRYLIKEELKLNQSEASDGWLTQDALWLVSKTVCDKLRAHLLSLGIEGVPDRNTAVFDVLQDHGIVQATPDAKAIWKATVASNSGWTQTFTFLKVSPALLWEAADRPASFSGSVRIEDNADASTTHTTPTIGVAPPSSGNTAPARPPSDAGPVVHANSTDAIGSVLALLQDEDPAPSVSENAPVVAVHPTAQLPHQNQPLTRDTRLPSDPPTQSDDPPGMQFMTWLRNGIQMRRLIINDAKALVHTVAGTVYLVSPGVFQRYVQERPDIARLARLEKVGDWEWVQKHFERLRLHKKQDSGLNIWTCEVTGPRKSRRLHGYLLLDGSALFTEVPFDNPYLKLLTRKTTPDGD
jgi:hypothetical protein